MDIPGEKSDRYHSFRMLPDGSSPFCFNHQVEHPQQQVEPPPGQLQLPLQQCPAMSWLQLSPVPWQFHLVFIAET